MITYTDAQGSDEWLAARRGVITASKFADARMKLRGGSPAKVATSYAMNVARERAGGTVPSIFQNAAMKTGTEQEPIARLQYEMETGAMVTEAGFICTDDRKFGVSVDGLIGEDGLWECKTMVSSDTLFTALVERDISAYRDQCIGALWLLHREWIDLSLWCPDLQLLHTVRITRDEQEIWDLETDLLNFEIRVAGYEKSLRVAMGSAPADAAPVAPTATAVRAELPEDIFA